MIIKDASDLDGSGMEFELGSTNTLKHCLEAFKALMCHNRASGPTLTFMAPGKGLVDCSMTPQLV